MIRSLKELFPNSGSLDKENSNARHIECLNSSEAFQETVTDINAYLEENKNRTPDYQIIKEIVERNSQRIEDNIDTLLSLPLYLGLMATILGAAVGIGYFAQFGLVPLLTGSALNADGIQTLLTDIAIAMGASFAGVLFTTWATSRFKKAKDEETRNKNRFLTWIQTNVVPQVSDDLIGAITKMAQDLNYFNSTFATNTQELKNTLKMVTDNYEGQAIDKIKITKIASANIKVYDRLQGCTEQLELLFDHLGQSQDYIAKVVELNSKLGDIEERTRLSEDLGQYFKQEIEFVQDRQGMMRQQISGLDSVMQEAFEELGTNVGNSLTNLTEVFQRQNSQVQQLIEDQQRALSESLEQQTAAINQKMATIGDPFAGMNQSIDQATQRIAVAFEKQNAAIQSMLAVQKQQLESELNAQKESLKKDPTAMSKQMSELSTVLARLNQTIENQQSEIDKLAVALQQQGGQDRRSKIARLLMPTCVCGSFLLLLGLLLIQLLVTF